MAIHLLIPAGVIIAVKVFAVVATVAAIGASAGWVVAQFAKKAKVKARAKMLSRFFVRVLRTQYSTIKLIAQATSGASGGYIMSDTGSYFDDTDLVLDIGEERSYKVNV